jgi:hypothetical protein
MAFKRIYLNRTAGEWEAINTIITRLGKSDLSTYLRGEIPKMQSKLNECRECITPANGEIEQKVILITEDSYKTIQELAQIMHTPLAAVIDELFITRLLLER